MIYKVAQIDNEYKTWIKENENSVSSNGKKRNGTFFSIIILCENIEIADIENPYYEILKSTKKMEELKKVVSMAQGEFFLIIDRPGKLDEQALKKLVCVDLKKEVQLIYSDEDYLVDGERCNPFFKPDWSPHTLKSFFYIGSAVGYRKKLMERLLEQSEELWENEWISKVLVNEIKRNQVQHISQILYHNISKCEITVMKSQEEKGRLQDDNKLVSIIIPSMNHLDVLRKCIDSIQEKTTCQKYEIIVVDNGSSEENRNRIVQYLQGKARYCYEKEEFNFSRMCNRGAAEAKGDFLLFLNDDTEVLQSDWLNNMLELAVLPYSGAVGAKLLYPGKKRIQHVGIVNLQSGPSHAFLGEKDVDSYFGRSKVDYNYIAVTGACLMVAKEKYLHVGGMDERLPIAYNDVDLCFKLYEAGWYNVVCNRTEVLHYESLSRGLDAYDEKKIQRLFREREVLFELHPGLQGKDPFYNKNLVTNKENFGLNIPRHRLKKADVVSVHKWNRYAYGNLNITIDGVTYGNDIVIEGWCLSENKEEDDIERKFVIQTRKSRVLLLDVDMVEREDVQQATGIVRANLGFKVVIPAVLRDIFRSAVRIGIWERLGENGDYFGELENNFEWEKLQKRELAVQISHNSWKDWKKGVCCKRKIEVQQDEREYRIQTRIKADLNKAVKVILIPERGGILCVDMKRQGEIMSGTVKRAQVRDITEYRIYLLEEEIEKGKIFYYKVEI